ncbi:hypothetical protein [Aquipseudomonas alcaligenes]|uniref:hypothetical protein n=1 Tax=Aquipseudomonas alcaligenes TaxID=43263 RepID=UPI0012E8FCF5|nr:hypothetical protein [Pseudomonas alcaligenes]
MMYGGLAATALYVIGVCSYSFLNWGDFQGLDPNSVGDFLAGAFSPLAFLWLVLGYFQQGQELRQNNEALHLQAKELSASVAQQVKMVEAQSKELLNYERSLEPLLKLSFDNVELDSEGDDYYSFSVHNLGEYCENMCVELDNYFRPYNVEFATMFRDEMRGFWIQCGSDREESFGINISYVNRSGVQGVQSFSFEAGVCEDGPYFTVKKKAFLS